MPVRLILSLLCGLASAHALAHSESEGAAAAGFIDCEHPAANVATALPEAVADAARIQCTPAMQSLVANDGWNWRYPGSFFDRPFIPAYAPEASRSHGGVRFFTDFRIRELSGDELNRHHRKFAREVPTYRETAAPSRIIQLVATNDLGHPMDAFFGFRSEKEGWVVLCTPGCEASNMFLMQKVE